MSNFRVGRGKHNIYFWKQSLEHKGWNNSGEGTHEIAIGTVNGEVVCLSAGKRGGGGSLGRGSWRGGGGGEQVWQLITTRAAGSPASERLVRHVCKVPRRHGTTTVRERGGTGQQEVITCQCFPISGGGLCEVRPRSLASARKTGRHCRPMHAVADLLSQSGRERENVMNVRIAGRAGRE